MAFHSIRYLLFFPAVVALSFATPHRHRWIVLLAASYVFYASWNAGYLLLIAASTLVSYLAGLGMESCDGKAYRRAWLLAALGANLGLLFFFKYFNFFSESAAVIAELLALPFEPVIHRLLLPVGISFYTFQSLSYAIDVARGERAAERHLGYFALYVSFFPQLVAGPIERSDHLIPQLRAERRFDPSALSDGLRLMLWGLFLKIVVADNLALYVNGVYNDALRFEGLPLIIATYFFSFQILCDFAGYSAIAIGSAKAMGIDLVENFRRPYLAKSFREFWRRWHISLSRWFRDYVYVPLGGNRTSRKRHFLNLLITFSVSGLWHGAAWTFVLWGMLHALYLILEWCVRQVFPWLRRRTGILWTIVRTATVFNAVSFAWILFRANSFRDAGHITTHLFSRWSAGSVLEGIRMSGAVFILSLLLILFVSGTLIVKERFGGYLPFVSRLPAALRWSWDYALILALLFLAANRSIDFIYFQF